ncbi:MAG TPA: DASS family sodium-coupled anion symporter [Gemmatimonadales bacterium]|nr:DASS family sodium-coupled anion symporter [Gemmatimonadales bacterium]
MRLAWLRTWGPVLAGPVAGAVIWALPAPAGMSPSAHAVAGLATWMALWWLTAILPLPVTALLPLTLLPLITSSGVERTAHQYADPIVFLFMGGFFLAAATERWQLHRRLALAVIGAVGTDPPRLVLALMIATAFVSMWISNTATAVMMLPLASAVLELARREAPNESAHLGKALILGVAYAASIGGVATLIGTPPTAIFAAAAGKVLGRPVGFAEWLAIGLPVATVLLLFCWVLLVRFLFPLRGKLPGVRDLVARERSELGPWTPGQLITVSVLALAAFSWIMREAKTLGSLQLPGLVQLLPGLSDAGIAIGAALVLFVFPSSLRERRFTLDWESATRIPWGVLILFGGGLALADAFTSSGLAEWIGGRLEGLRGAPAIVVIGTVALLFVLLTELTSNTATAAMAMPIMAALAPAVGMAPVGLMATAALGSALGFMLPVGTPPNALAFGTGAVSSREMARAGVWMDLVSALVITVAVLLWTG